MTALLDLTLAGDNGVGMSETDEDFAETVELVTRARAGDRAALDELLGRHSASLLAKIRVMMGEGARRRADSGDFLQGVFVEVLEGFDRFQPCGPEAFLRWAAQIARNNIRDAVGRRGEQPTVDRPSGLSAMQRGPGSVAEHNEDSNQLRAALAQLPDLMRQVVELRNRERLAYAEVGRRIGRTENAARLLHGRAMLRLGRAIRHPSGDC